MTRNPPEVPYLQRRCETTGNGYVLPSTTGGIKKTTRVRKFAAGLEELKTRVNTIQDNVKIVECCGTHFGVNSENGSHTRCEPLKTTPANKHVRTTRKSRKKIESLCLLFLSPHGVVFFVQQMRATQFSYAVSFSRRLLKNYSSE